MDEPEVLRSAIPVDYAVMALCQKWASLRSKDPSTKVGACVYDESTGAMHFGYNGFPKGVPDLADVWTRRERQPGEEDLFTKYDLVVHAEVNAITKALRAGVIGHKCTMYVTHFPCPRCMRDVVANSGIRHIVYESADYVSCTPQTMKQTTQLARWMHVHIRKLGHHDAPQHL